VLMFGIALIGSSFLGVSEASAGGLTLERAANLSGTTTFGGMTGYGVNLYSINSRANAYSVNVADDLMRWNPTGSNGLLKIKSGYNNNYCLTATSLSNNATVYAKPCGQANQDWTLNGVSGSQLFRARQGNFCLNLTNGNLFNGGYLFMYQCASSVTGDIEQLWQFTNH
jgi:Ricin-type beta-trefoil lectin domain